PASPVPRRLLRSPSGSTRRPRSGGTRDPPARSRLRPALARHGTRRNSRRTGRGTRRPRSGPPLPSSWLACPAPRRMRRATPVKPRLASTVTSSPSSFASVRRDEARRLDSGSQSERYVLARRPAGLSYDDEAGHDAKGDLRRDKPEPVDPALQLGIEQTQDRVQGPRPQDRRDESAEQDRPPREHRQHRAV